MAKSVVDYCIKELFYEEANIDSLKEIKCEGVKMQEYIESSTNTVVSKAHNLFQILIIIISTLIGYLMSLSKLTPIAILSIIVVISLIFTIILLYRIAYFTDNYAALGSEPKNLLHKETFIYQSDKEGFEDKNYKELLRFLVQSVQRNIDINIRTHMKIVERFELATQLIIGTLIFAIVSVIFILTLYPS